MSTSYKILGSYLKKGKDSGCVNIFVEGIDFAFDSGTHQFYPWETLESYLYYVNRTTTRLYGIIPIYRSTKYIVNLQFQNAELITLKKRHYPELDELSKVLLQVTLKTLLSKYLARIEEGSTLKFDKLSIDKSGVYRGKKAVAWFDVEGAKVENGVVFVYARNPLKPNKPGLIGTVGFQTPNAHVLTSLVTALAKNVR